MKKKTHSNKAHRPLILDPEAPELTAAGRFHWLLDRLFAGNQTHMAKFLGCTQSTVSQVIYGRWGPSPRLLRKLSEHREVNPEWVLHGAGGPLRPAEDRALDATVLSKDWLYAHFPHGLPDNGPLTEQLLAVLTDVLCVRPLTARQREERLTQIIQELEHVREKLRTRQ